MNINEIERREKIAMIVWNVTIVTLLAALAAVVLIVYANIRESRRTERGRIRAACPSGTAQRVIDRVNQEPCVRLCSRIADAVFGDAERKAVSHDD